MTGPPDDQADVDVVQGVLDRLPPARAVPVDEHPADAQPLPETTAAVAALRGYIDATATAAAPGTAAAARSALDTLDRQTSAMLPLDAVAARLNIGDDLARHLVATGRLPSVRLGGRTIRVPAAALARLATTPSAASVA